MELLYKVLLVVHLLSWAFIVGAWFTHLHPPVVVKGVWHVALVALVTGLLLVGIAEGGTAGPDDVNHAKIGIKLVIAAAVTVLAMMAPRQQGPRAAQFAHGVGALAVLNVAIAVLWGGPHG